MKKITPLVLTALILATSGCRDIGNGKTPVPKKPETSKPEILEKLKTFGSADELSAYLKSAQEDQAGDGTGSNAYESPSAAEDSDASSASPNQEITNNQEEGVDEGGLVKNYNNFLITLRRGRLVSIQVGAEGILTKIDEEEMTPPGLNRSVWYDELLVEGDLVLVIGYRYSIIPAGDYYLGATELNLFRISEAGELSRLETYFFESNDYYSWRNYAGRMVDGKLVLYFPYYLGFFLDEGESLKMPRIFRLTGGTLSEIGTLFGPTEIYRPLKEIKWPTFHALLTCDLSDPHALDCSPQVVIDSWFRELYVTQERAYLWIDDVSWWGDDEEKGPARVYALALDGTTSGVAEVEGSPIDQFSLSENAEGMDALTVEYQMLPCSFGRSCGWQTNYRLNQIAFSDFSDELSGESDANSVPLPGQWVSVNRFSATHLAYGADTELVVVERKTGEVTRIPVEEWVQRIELAGERFLAVGQRYTETGESSLSLKTVDTGVSPKVAGSYQLPDLYQSEWRSHGYAFHASEEADFFGLGTLELRPVEGSSDDLWFPYDVISSVSFFKIDEDGAISDAGKMSEQAFSQEGKSCTTSCIDWYGNTRPIFLGDHVMALIGDQIGSARLDSEGRLDPSSALHLFTGETVLPIVEE